LLSFACEGNSGVTQVVEEGGEVSIIRIDLVPNARQFAHVEPRSHQSRLTGSGWPSQKDGRPWSRPIQELEQTLACYRTMQARAGQFGELWSLV
jgi:hypothetical protein